MTTPQLTPRPTQVTWYSVAVSIKRIAHGYIDERTIALPMLAPPDKAEIEAALEPLGWGGYQVVGFGYQEIRS